jgi:WD40 repeat protein
MAIQWSCSCGRTFNTAEASAGVKLVCTRCGKINICPGQSISAGQPPVEPQKKAAPPATIPQVKVDSPPIPEVEPIDEDEDIPEVDVEEHVSAWDKEKKRPEPKKPKKPKTPKDITDPFEIDGSPEVEPNDEEAAFARKLAAAGANAWSHVGAIKLVDVAECVAVGPGGAYGLAGQDDDVLVINLLKGKKLDRFGGHDGVVTCVAMSFTGDLAVSGDNLGEVMYWEIPTRKRRRLLRDHRSPVTAVAISSNGDFAASGDRDGSTRLWHLKSGQDDPLADSDWPEKVTTIAFSSDSTLLASASSRGRVVVWSVKKGTATQRFRLHSPAVTSLQFGPRNETLIAATKPENTSAAVLPMVWQLDLRNGRAYECLRPAEKPRSCPYYATLDQGGRRLITIGSAIGDAEFFKGLNVVEIWNIATGEQLHASADLKGDVECVAIAPNNSRLVASLAKRQLQVFAMPDGVDVKQITLRPDDRVRRKQG